MSEYLFVENLDSMCKNIWAGDDCNVLIGDVFSTISLSDDVLDAFESEFGGKPSTANDYTWCYVWLTKNDSDDDKTYHLMRRNSFGSYSPFVPSSSSPSPTHSISTIGVKDDEIKEVLKEEKPEFRYTKNFVKNGIAKGFTNNAVQVEGIILGIGSTSITIRDKNGKLHTIEKRTAHVEERNVD